MPIDYKKAGVDMEAGDKLVEWLGASSTAVDPQLLSGIGGFAAIYKLQLAGMKSPCLVSSTDGVGTKVKLAAQFAKYDTVGQDLVAMCVNDLICTGARPLFFLDYYAVSKLDLEAAQSLLGGIRAACAKAQCALIGGETAEMPGVYHGRDFDLAGFSVGIVDEGEILGAHRVKSGDRVLGIESSGFHSNGYSLLRKVFEADLELWADRLLVPTHLYVEVVMKLVRAKLINACANITGAGMENIPRVMPAGTYLPLQDWAWPEHFVEVQDRTDMSREQMLKTLNCGIGMTLFVDPKNVNAVEAEVQRAGFKCYHLGTVEQAPNPGGEAYVQY